MNYTNSYKIFLLERSNQEQQIKFLKYLISVNLWRNKTIQIKGETKKNKENSPIKFN